MKHRSKFFKIYTTFQALVKIEYFVVIKCFRCDLGGEYTSNKFYELFVLDGTIHQTLCIDNPEQNGFTERKHRHIIEIVHSFLLSTFVPSVFLGEVVFTVVGLINTISSSYILGFSPFKKLCGYVLDYSFFRIFYSTCFVLCPHVEHSKLSSRFTICVFLGYGKGKKRYCYFNLVIQKHYMSHHIVFLEHISFFISSTTHNLYHLILFV